MLTSALLLVCSWQAPQCGIDVCMIQVYPPRRGASTISRSTGQDRAVILLQGLDLRDDGFCPTKPRFQHWQGSTSDLVRNLSGYADVFAISYAQTTAVEDVAAAARLHKYVAQIKKLGYQRVVLIGHSAGGLVARHLVEDFPDTAVDMVIQIATPNGGCKLADWSVRLKQCPTGQTAFINSLSHDHRTKLLDSRTKKKIPARIDFVVLCVFSSAKANGDSVVSCHSQWTRELQLQRIPCLCIYAKHNEATCSEECMETVAGLVRDGMPRWSRRQVFEMRQWMGFVPSP